MKKATIFVFAALFLSAFFFIKPAQAIDLCRWQGYANISGTAVSSSSYITAHNGTRTYNATIFSGGLYSVSVEAPSEDVIISFKICGVDAQQGGQAWSCPAARYNLLNLSISSLSTGASCTYSCACSGGYCCSGATQYTAGEGTGTCQASACSAGTTGTTAPPGGGGPAATTTTTTTISNATTTTTTTTLPPVQETKALASIPAGGLGDFNFTNANLVIYSIVVNTSAGATSPSLTEAQTSAAPVSVSTVAPNIVYGYIVVTKSNMQDADVNSAKIRFKISKAWLTQNKIDTNSVALYRYVSGVWVKLATVKLSEDSTYVYFESTSPGLSVFAISSEKVDFWYLINQINKYYSAQVTFWSLIDVVSVYYS